MTANLFTRFLEARFDTWDSDEEDEDENILDLLAKYPVQGFANEEEVQEYLLKRSNLRYGFS